MNNFFMLISQKRSFSLSGRRAKGNPIASRNFLRQTIDGQGAPGNNSKKVRKRRQKMKQPREILAQSPAFPYAVRS
jgi:hypothetical protein